MSTPRRQLGHGPQAQPQVSPTGTGLTRRVRAAQADIEAAPLYRPGGLDTLDQLRARGVLGTTTPPA